MCIRDRDEDRSVMVEAEDLVEKNIEENKSVADRDGETIVAETNQDETDNNDIHVGEMASTEEVLIDDLEERHQSERKYHLPITDLLETPVNISDTMSRDELIDRANFLTQSLSTFGVEGRVVNVHPGPIITLFEVEPAEGVRVNKFVQLSDDLARVMEASRVRVIALSLIHI